MFYFCRNNAFLYLYKANQQRVRLAEQMNEVVLNITRQVAHDIRSPLSALNMVMGSVTVSEDKHLVIKNALLRVNDIANDLLSKGRDTKGYVSTNASKALKQVVHLSALIEAIVSEKESSIKINPQPRSN